MPDVKELSDVDLWATFNICNNVLATSKMRFEKCIGEGMSSSVALVRGVFDEDEKMAMKLFHSDVREKDKKRTRMFEAMFLREVSILQHVDHKNILPIVTAYVSPNNDHRVIAMPYYPGGDLLDHLRELTIEMMQKYFLQLANAVYYLNKRRIIHRDIKPENVLFNSKGDAILIDFGLAFVLNKELHDRESGTIGYMPPEVFTDKPLDRYKGDAFALGVTLLNMANQTAEYPHPKCPHCVCLLHPNRDPAKIFSFLIKRLCHHHMYTRWSVECMVAKKNTFPELDSYLSQVEWK